MHCALVHEWLTPKATGGSELVVREILKHIEADLYALIDFESINPDSYLYGRQIGTTFLQNFPFASSHIQKYLPFFPLAIEQLDLRDYEVIISSSHAVAKGILTSPSQMHISYCHTPMRYAWDLTYDYLQRSRAGRGIAGIYTRYLLHSLRQWDVISANRVDYFIANSRHTASRIWRCYRREAEVIYPPVAIERFTCQKEKEDFFLTVSRLVSYKQIGLIVESFNQLGYPLVIIGDGPELSDLKQKAKANITFKGAQSNEVVEEYMRKAKAFVYAACEDFGIALVEAQACGTPVIAYGKGGARETVIDFKKSQKNATGLFFLEQNSKSLAQSVETFLELQHHFNAESCYLQATRFSPEVFRSRFLSFLESSFANWSSRAS
jgi:glycosyltransferase involved in cell wall biosynthesis